MTLYLAIAIVALIGTIVFLAMGLKFSKKTIRELSADKKALLKNIAALNQNAIDNDTIAAWKKSEEAKIEAGQSDDVLAGIIAGNNAGVRDGKTSRDNTAS